MITGGGQSRIVPLGDRGATPAHGRMYWYLTPCLQGSSQVYPAKTLNTGERGDSGARGVRGMDHATALLNVSSRLTPELAGGIRPTPGAAPGPNHP